jgi:hypothetical protein
MNARPILQFGAKIFFVRRKLVYDATVNDIQNVVPRMAVRFRFGDEGDLMRLSESTHDYDKAARELSLERLRAGDRLVLAESKAGRGNEIVFYGWLMSGHLDMGVRKYFPLSADSVYSYRLFTAANHRGKKLCAAYFAFIRERLETTDQRRILSWVEARNLISRRVHEAAGFHSIGSIWHIQFLFGSYFYVPKALRASLRKDSLRQYPGATAAGVGASRA